MEGPFVMRKGQWLTHEGGERYAVALEDILLHSYVRSDQFEMADGTKPRPHDPIPEDVMRADPFGQVKQVCVDGEWKVIEHISSPYVSDPSSTGGLNG